MLGSITGGYEASEVQSSGFRFGVRGLNFLLSRRRISSFFLGTTEAA